MCRCIETIRVEGGAALHLGYHQRRFDDTRRELFPDSVHLALEEVIPANLPAEGLFKLRLVYGREVEEVCIERYQRRSIRSLACVASDEIEYRRKWADRRALQGLLALAPGADDIIIVRRGLITDSSYSNLAFLDGRGWVTPLEPLLQGTARARLIEQGTLICRPLAITDLKSFTHVSLINAMNDPGELVVPMDAVSGITGRDGNQREF